MRILILLSLISLECVRADAWTWTMSSAIPDNDPSGMQNTQSVSGYTEVIESISVRLRLSGDPLAFGGDLFVSLQSENGGYAVLLNRVGRSAGDSFGYDTNGFDVTFAIGGNDIHRYRDFAYSYNGDDALVGTWGADARNIDPDHVLDSDARTRDLDQFAGINPNGNWTLFVADLSPNGVARLEAWGLEIHVIPEPGALLLAGILLGSAGMAAAVRRNFRVSGPCRWKSVCVLRCHTIGGSATSNQKKSSGKYGTGGAGNPGGNFEREGLQCGTEKTELRKPDAEYPLGGVLDIHTPAGLIQIISFAQRFPAVIQDGLAEAELLLREKSLLRILPLRHLVVLNREKPW